MRSNYTDAQNFVRRLKFANFAANYVLGRLRKECDVTDGECIAIMNAQYPRNREGLTWPEWRNAAHVATYVAFEAWLRGEDPTEWRAAPEGSK